MDVVSRYAFFLCVNFRKVTNLLSYLFCPLGVAVSPLFVNIYI